MDRHRIVFLDRNAIRVPLRAPDFPHEWREYTHTLPEDTVARLCMGATMAITNRVRIDADILDAVPSMQLVAVSATGFEHVDVAACRARGVSVCNVRDWAVSVPEHVFTLALALRRQLLMYRTAVEDGRWAASSTYGLILDPLPRTLGGSTLGLIGYGALARRVERIALGFGMRVLVAERKGIMPREDRVPLGEVLSQSDVLVVLCPLTSETRGLIGAEELALMRRDALLINCARGGIVREDALAGALVQGRIGGAATDVLSEEPPKHGNPLLKLSLPNLIVTPHVAWLSTESQHALAEQLIGNLEAFACGKPRNLV